MQTNPIQLNDVGLATGRIHVRGMLLRDRWNNGRAVGPPDHAEKNPRAISQDRAIESAAVESATVEGDTRALSTPVWSALKVAVVIFALYIVGATFLAVVVFAPGLKLLGFFVALAIMVAAGMPMLSASISVAAEDATSASLRPETEPGSTIRGASLGEAS